MSTNGDVLRVVVADDHHHVLPEIHLAIRRRVLPFQGIHIVHFDAHPDLSFSSSIAPAVIYEPDRLNDALDESVSGIAEFLLPLVYAGHVNSITWIKSPWASQMPVGSMADIAVGRLASTDRLAVSCPWSHFVDDDLYASESDMELASIKRWTLDVRDSPDILAPSGPWILDIDLDYFSTWNPFQKDLESLCDPETIQIITHVFTRVRYRADTQLSVNRRIRERTDFLECIRRLESEQLYLDPDSSAALSILKTLESLYIEDATSVLYQFFGILSDADDATRSLVWNAAPCLDLPHFENPEEGIEAMIFQFRNFLASVHTRPALVTVATSVSDCFLPPHQLEFVRDRVIAAIQDTLGPVFVDHVEYE